MQKLFTWILLLFIASPALLRAQCTPDPGFTGEGIYPDTVTNMGPACVGAPYAQTFTIRVTPDTMISGFLFTVNYVQITGVTGMPAGFSYACSPANCTFPGGTTGCAIVTGTPTSVQAGTYPLAIQVTFSATNGIFGTITQAATYTGYELIIHPQPDPGLPAGTLDLCSHVSNSLSGAAGFSSYSWTENGIPAGNTQNVIPTQNATWTLTVTDANGCTASDTTQVALHAPPTLSPGQTDPSCGTANGSVWGGPTGGTQPYTFTWSTGDTIDTLSGLSAGFYTLTVQDVYGCSVSQAYTLNNLGGPSIQSVLGNSPSCFGAQNGTASVTATGGTGAYTYLWSNGDTTQNLANLGPGTYSVSVTDVNGCVAAGSINLTQPTQLTLGLTPTSPSCGACNDGNALASPAGGTPPYSYAWSNGSNATLITNLTTGTYTCTVTDAQGCTVVDTVQVTFIVGRSAPAANSLEIWPLPAQNLLQYQLHCTQPGTVILRITDVQGRVLITESCMGSGTVQGSLNTASLAPGLYLLECRQGDARTVQRVQIQR